MPAASSAAACVAARFCKASPLALLLIVACKEHLITSNNQAHADACSSIFLKSRQYTLSKMQLEEVGACAPTEFAKMQQLRLRWRLGILWRP